MEIRTFLRANADRVAAVGLVILGAIALILGWVGVSGTGLAAQQIPYLVSGGIGGLSLIVIGCSAWVSADVQDEWRRLDAIEERLDELAAQHRARVDEMTSRNGSSPKGRRRTRAPATRAE